MSEVPESEVGKFATGLARKAGEHYLKTQSHTGNRLDRLILAYDAAIRAARQEDAEQTKRVLGALISALDFDHVPEFGLGQLRMYKHCLRAAQEGHFKEVIHLLSSVRDAWEVLRQSRKAGL